MVVIVHSGDRSVFDTQVTAGRHEFTADEPVEAGGHDGGPSPYDLLLAALGTCTSMTIRLYAQRRGYPLDDVQVTLEHDRIHAKDCADCDTTDGHLSRIQRKITLHGDLTPAQRTDLLRVADKCPVHRTLDAEIVVVTSSD